jgi:hypothetical protein
MPNNPEAPAKSPRTIASYARATIGLFALVTAANATIQPDRTDVPSLIMVMFKTGDTADFYVRENTSLTDSTNGTVTGLTLQVAMRFYQVPLTDCRSLKNVHAETARFADYDIVKRKQGTFSFTFRMGDESTRRFGELPQIQITYLNGRFAQATMTRLDGPHSYFTSPLCFAPL